jgi:peroxiredoxin Q/BCP
MNVGDTAPDFELNDQDGNPVRLSDLAGNNVVLYFYPRDNTPGCTKEACSIRNGYDEIKKQATVLGVSTDSVKSHKNFAEKYRLPFTLLSDQGGKVAKKYGVFSLFTRRITFVIGRNGKIRHVFKNVDVVRHADEILEVLANNAMKTAA